ncbi:MAG TPA: RsmG family class I SAM-dependent methyltransferase [Polyangiaceae bacterium]|nr:RsmG family class I SAM-dependent methyltransferase [Polyangiaceae bacterium]
MPLARLGNGWRPRIERVLAEVPASCGRSFTAPPQALPQLVSWLDLVVAWSERVDLTAARDADTLVDLLLADAVLLASTQLTGSVIDVGSGVGAPAIPLAILLPTLTLTLVEPRDRRAAFLRTSCGSLSRPDIRLLRTRSMEVETGIAELALSRATLPPPLWLREGARLAQRGVWVLLGQDEPPTLASWHADLDLSYDWPLTGGRRRAVRYVRD